MARGTKSAERPSSLPPGAKTWRTMVGLNRTDPTRVYAFENWQRQGVVTLRYWIGGVEREEAQGLYLRTKHGTVDRQRERAAIALAESKHRELVAPREAVAEPDVPLMLGETAELLTDPKTGRYPPPHTGHHLEALRHLAFAVATWGVARPWNTIKRHDWTALGRAAVDHFAERAGAEQRTHAKSRNNARDRGGYDTAVKTVKRVLTIARWLVDREAIEPGAAVPPKALHGDLKAYWTRRTGSVAVPTPQNPRHSLDEMRRILSAMRDVDPRGFLILAIGAELRAGQVSRIRRSDCHLEATDVAPNGRVIVHGAGKKNGETVFLTRGQRQALDEAMTVGYLRDFESALQAGQLTDYALFPGGRLRYLIGNSWNTKERVAPYAPLPDALLQRSSIYPVARQRPIGIVSGEAMNAWFLEAERIAKVKHVRGRAFYGVRRVTVDETMDREKDPRVLEKMGGWSNPKVPTEIYADRESQTAMATAMRVRADIRGEEQPT